MQDSHTGFRDGFGAYVRPRKTLLALSRLACASLQPCVVLGDLTGCGCRPAARRAWSKIAVAATRGARLKGSSKSIFSETGSENLRPAQRAPREADVLGNCRPFPLALPPFCANRGVRIGLWRNRGCPTASLGAIRCTSCEPARSNRCPGLTLRRAGQ